MPYYDNQSAQPFLGQNFNFLSNYLQGASNGTIPGADQMRQTAYGKINTQTNNSAQRLKENMAANGMGQSGIASSALASLYGSGAGAIGDFESNLAEKELSFKQNAVSQLLGLNSFEGGQRTGLETLGQNQAQMDQQALQFQKQLDFQKDSQPSWLGQLLGGVLGAGAQVGSAYFLGKK